MNKKQPAKRNDDPRFEPPPSFTEAEIREAFDAGHKAMHLTIKSIERKSR